MAFRGTCPVTGVAVHRDLSSSFQQQHGFGADLLVDIRLRMALRAAFLAGHRTRQLPSHGRPIPERPVPPSSTNPMVRPHPLVRFPLKVDSLRMDGGRGKQIPVLARLQVQLHDKHFISLRLQQQHSTNLLAEFRYLNLNESLTMTEDVTRLTADPMFPDEVTGAHPQQRTIWN